MSYRITRGRLIAVMPFTAKRSRPVSVRGRWVKSSFSGMGDCVQWNIEDGRVRVRDSKDPAGPELVFTHSEWEAFRRGITAGEGAL